MRSVALAVGIGLAVVAFSGAAAAQAPLPALPPPASSVPGPPSSPPPALAALPAPPPAAAPVGLAVVALGGATDAAWPLARSVYATPSLRPAALDEAHARVLCGEPAPAAAPHDLRDLADTLAAVKGDDAPSRMLLVEVAHRLNVRALVVVRTEGGAPVARVFLPESGAYDAASYAPDAGATVAWSGAVGSLVRTFGAEVPAPPPAPLSAPALATHEEPVVAAPPPRSKAFYETGWFWGAVGAAAFAGGAIFFATRDNGDSTIHLQAQVPH
ncbi:MAG TPA: hypothetical protein VGG39_31590 [Polyangiaceae bacterium]|jgi:hypothetical protein